MNKIIELTKNDNFTSEYENIKYIKVDEKIFNYFKGQKFWNNDKTLCIYFFKYNPIKTIYSDNELFPLYNYDDHESYLEKDNKKYTLILKDDCIKNRLLFKNIHFNYHLESIKNVNISIRKNVNESDIDKHYYEYFINFVKKNLDKYEPKLKIYSDLIKLFNEIKDKYTKETNDQKSFIEFGTTIQKINIDIEESIKSVKINPKFFEMTFALNDSAHDNTSYQFRNIKFEKIIQNTEVSITAGESLDETKIIFTFNNIRKELKYTTDYYLIEFDMDELKLLKLMEICNLYDDLSYFTNNTNFEIELECKHKYF